MVHLHPIVPKLGFANAGSSSSQTHYQNHWLKPYQYQDLPHYWKITSMKTSILELNNFYPSSIHTSIWVGYPLSKPFICTHTCIIPKKSQNYCYLHAMCHYRMWTNILKCVMCKHTYLWVAGIWIAGQPNIEYFQVQDILVNNTFLMLGKF